MDSNYFIQWGNVMHLNAFQRVCSWLGSEFIPSRGQLRQALHGEASFLIGMSVMGTPMMEIIGYGSLLRRLRKRVKTRSY